MNLGTAQVIRANSRHLPLADDSVDLVVTSPPYFALRSYQDGGEHYAGQIGDEPTPAEFVDSLLEVTRECVRVLKPSGSLWVNLGDKYAGRSGGPQGSAGARADRSQAGTYGSRRPDVSATVRDKSLIGIPWRYALRCIDDLGLILRAEVIWSKPNGLPESVTDRVRRSHEQWFHFVLQPRYFSAVDEIREQYAPETTARYAYGFKPASAVAAGQSANGPTRADGGGPSSTNPLGKLPGSVWTVPTEPLRAPDHLGVDHFAAFPTEWPKRIIAGWSPAGVCVECGEGRRPARGTTCEECDGFRPNNAKECPECGHRRDWKAGRVVSAEFGADDWSTAGHGTPRHPGRHENRSVIVGYACACPEPTAPTRPSVILDPFGGTGTTAMVAKALGRHGISVDMSADYCRLAEWRTNDRDQLAKVLGIAKAEPVHADEASLFDLLGEASA